MRIINYIGDMGSGGIFDTRWEKCKAPNWVINACYRKYYPYDGKFYLYGKTFNYKGKFLTVGQGQYFIKTCYRKLKR